MLANNKSLQTALIGVGGHGAAYLRGTLRKLNIWEEN